MKNLFLLLALVVSLGLITAPPDSLHAATFNVTTTNISGPGSLPVAIAQANATPGDNQIQISVTNPITLGVPLPTVTNSVAIAGIASVPSIISGGGTLPLFTFATGTTNSLSNLVLANGYTTFNGAAISNASTLTVSSCVMMNNYAAIQGGAVCNSGAMAISSSVISGNQAGDGGALYNSGTLTLNNSKLLANQAIDGGAIDNAGSLSLSTITISNNIATGGFGGGVFNTGTLAIICSTFVSNAATNTGVSEGGALFSRIGFAGITNSTFYQNSAIGAPGYGGSIGYGGAIFVDFNGYVSLINCTIANNSSQGRAGGQGIGGGINNTNQINNTTGTILLLNTIVAGNIAANGSSPDLNGAFVSSGVNLIGNNQGATGLSIFDFQNVAANLGPLQNNGGSTLTCAPLTGSFAIGYGTSVGAPLTDQRGVPRPQNGAFDIGAVQVVTNSPYVTGAAMVTGSGFTLNTIFDATNRYRIQASTNLTTWIGIYTNGNGGGIQYTDSAATNLNRRFYRTVTP
jgi:hypothetical protein